MANLRSTHYTDRLAGHKKIARFPKVIPAMTDTLTRGR